MSKQRKAFTLVELLVVIAIIGILFVVLISKVDFATEKSKATGVQTDFRSYQVAIETVARENAGLSVLVDNDATGEEKYAELEKALNKNLDPKLHVEIDADGKISTEAKDPWKEQYLGAYLAPDTDGTVKDRGAIVMYSKGSNLKLGTTAATENGIVNVTLESGKETEGADDYSISTIYTYINGYGEIQASTSGFSNNQGDVAANGNNGSNVTPSVPGGSDPSDPGQEQPIVQQEYTVQAVSNVTDAGVVELTANGHIGTSLTLTGAQNIQITATPNNGYFFRGWKDGNNYISTREVYNYSVSGEKTFVAVFEKQLAAGLYDSEGTLVADWDTLVNTYGMDIERDYTDQTVDEPSSPTSVLGHEDFVGRAEKLVIDDSVTRIGSCAFLWTDLHVVVLGSSVTSIGNSAFSISSLEEIIMQNSVTSIETSAFSAAELRDLVIPDSVTSIGSGAFGSNYNLQDVYLGSGIADIDDDFSGLFSSCEEISIVMSATEPPEIFDDADQFDSSSVVIYVPNESVDAYKNAEGWSVYADLIKPLSEKPTE